MHGLLGLLELVVGGDVRLVKQLNLVLVVLNLKVDVVGQLTYLLVELHNFFLKLFLVDIFACLVLLFGLQHQLDNFLV